MGIRADAYYKGFGARKFCHKYRWLEGLDALILNGYEHHRVYHSNNEFAKAAPQTAPKTSGVTAKNRMHKFHGIDGNLLFLASLPPTHLKKCEFGYYNRNENWCLTSISILDRIQSMKYNRLSTIKLNKIFLCFAQDITATATAKRSFCEKLLG